MNNASALNKSSSLNSSSLISNAEQSHYHSLADQMLAGNEVLASVVATAAQQELMTDDEYKLFLAEMQGLHHSLLKDTIEGDRAQASEDWWNSLAINKNASNSSSPNTKNTTPISGISVTNDDDENDEESSSSLVQLRKLLPNNDNLLSPRESSEKQTTMHSPPPSFPSPKHKQNSTFIEPRDDIKQPRMVDHDLSNTSPSKHPKQRKRKDMFFDNLAHDNDLEEMLLNLAPSSPSNHSSSRSNRQQVSLNNGALDTVTINRKEYEDLKTEIVILQGRLIQMELMHEKLLSMILK